MAEAIQQLHALEMAARVRRLAYVAEFDRREAWRVDGATCTAAWLMATCGQSRHSAATEVGVARALQSLPAIAAAAAEGVLSWDQLVALVAIATPETDADLAVEAAGWSAAQLQALARAARRRTDGEADAADSGRYLRWRVHHLDGTWRLAGRFSADAGAVVDAALSQLADAHNRVDDDGNYETLDARRADALVELASTQLASQCDADRACVVIHADAGGFSADPAGDPAAAANLQDGASLAVSTLRRLACDCRWQLVTEHPDGSPAGIGRTSRQIPPWLSRALRRRDGHCRFPGCDRTRWTQGHHLTHWIDGGATDLTNLSMLCVRHHHLVHEAGWTLEGDPNGTLTFTTPHGKTLTSRPTPLRPDIKTRIFGPDPPQHPAHPT